MNTLEQMSSVSSKKSKKKKQQFHDGMVDAGDAREARGRPRNTELGMVAVILYHVVIFGYAFLTRNYLVMMLVAGIWFIWISEYLNWTRDDWRSLWQEHWHKLKEMPSVRCIFISGCKPDLWFERISWFVNESRFFCVLYRSPSESLLVIDGREEFRIPVPSQFWPLVTIDNRDQNIAETGTIFCMKRHLCVWAWFCHFEGCTPDWRFQIWKVTLGETLDEFL